MYSSYIDRGQKAIERCGREKKKREHGCVHFAEAGDAFIFLKTKLYYCALHKEVR